MTILTPKTAFPNTAYLFHCKKCGCLFVAEWKECYVEQKYDFSMDLKYQIWRCNCPKCGKKANTVKYE